MNCCVVGSRGIGVPPRVGWGDSDLSCACEVGRCQVAVIWRGIRSSAVRETALVRGASGTTMSAVTWVSAALPCPRGHPRREDHPCTPRRRLLGPVLGARQPWRFHHADHTTLERTYLTTYEVHCPQRKFYGHRHLPQNGPFAIASCDSRKSMAIEILDIFFTLAHP